MSAKRPNDRAEESSPPAKTRKTLREVEQKLAPNKDSTTTRSTRKVNLIVTSERLEEAGGHDAQGPTGTPASEDGGDGDGAANTVQEVVNGNPFAALFKDSGKILKGTCAITGAPGGGVFELFVVPVVNMLEVHPPADARRLLACAAHPNVPLKHPKGGIVNVALQDPGNLSFNNTSGYLLSKETGSWVLSTLLGEACYFSSGAIKQICITPSAHGWHRFVAVLASVYRATTLFFPTFQDGVSFATSQFSSSNGGKRRSKGIGGPIEGPELKEGADIPIFDGREQFKLGSFWEKTYEGEVKAGSTVMLLFSVKRGGLGAKAKTASDLPRDVAFAMYFNILAVIVLKDPAEDFEGGASREGPHAFGVDNVAEEFGSAGEVGDQKEECVL